MCKNGPNGPNGPSRPKKDDQILLAIQIHRDESVRHEQSGGAGPAEFVFLLAHDSAACGENANPHAGELCD